MCDCIELADKHLAEPRDGATDATHKKLRRAVEKRQRSHLWTPADAITFVPRLLPTIYGDGRALFTIATINQRPAYWIVRACSTWGSGMDREDSPGPDFAEMTDDLLTALEEAFGNGRCGYSGNSLFWPKKERIQHCQCEECADRHVAKWPEVDGTVGCSWSRMDWPALAVSRPHGASSLIDFNGRLVSFDEIERAISDRNASTLSLSSQDGGSQWLTGFP